MPLVLQLHLVIMRKYSKFGVDTLNTFWLMGKFWVFKFLQDENNDDDLAITIAQHFLRNRQAKSVHYSLVFFCCLIVLYCPFAFHFTIIIL